VTAHDTGMKRVSCVACPVARFDPKPTKILRIEDLGNKDDFKMEFLG
jgi:hypothetical protein